jgi:hypothetical protein
VDTRLEGRMPQVADAPVGLAAAAHPLSALQDGAPVIPVSGMDAISDSIAARLSDVTKGWVTDHTSAQIFADIRATQVTLGVTRDQLRYHLTIVEEALSRAQEAGTQRGDVVSF